jgi:cytolysin-activating lysine-acyltransferase
MSEIDQRTIDEPLAGPTFSHVFGEMAWLLTQSPLHRGLSVGDLEWLLMPPLIHEQLYIFREGNRPIGLALWAYCSAATEKKLEAGLLESPNRITFEEWKAEGRIWLVDLIAPFATAENRQREMMIADLISGPLSGQEFRFHQTDASTGQRSVNVVSADAGEKLKSHIAELLKAGE